MRQRAWFATAVFAGRVGKDMGKSSDLRSTPRHLLVRAIAAAGPWLELVGGRVIRSCVAARRSLTAAASVAKLRASATLCALARLIARLWRAALRHPILGSTSCATLAACAMWSAVLGPFGAIPLFVAILYAQGFDAITAPATITAVRHLRAFLEGAFHAGIADDAGIFLLLYSIIAWLGCTTSLMIVLLAARLSTNSIRAATISFVLLFFALPGVGLIINFGFSKESLFRRFAEEALNDGYRIPDAVNLNEDLRGAVVLLLFMLTAGATVGMSLLLNHPRAKPALDIVWYGAGAMAAGLYVILSVSADLGPTADQGGQRLAGSRADHLQFLASLAFAFLAGAKAGMAILGLRREPAPSARPH